MQWDSLMPKVWNAVSILYEWKRHWRWLPFILWLLLATHSGRGHQDQRWFFITPSHSTSFALLLLLAFQVLLAIGSLGTVCGVSLNVTLTFMTCGMDGRTLVVLIDRIPNFWLEWRTASFRDWMVDNLHLDEPQIGPSLHWEILFLKGIQMAWKTQIIPLLFFYSGNFYYNAIIELSAIVLFNSWKVHLVSVEGPELIHCSWFWAIHRGFWKQSGPNLE